jgi:hypothetical protein
MESNLKRRHSLSSINFLNKLDEQQFANPNKPNKADSNPLNKIESENLNGNKNLSILQKMRQNQNKLQITTRGKNRKIMDYLKRKKKINSLKEDKIDEPEPLNPQEDLSPVKEKKNRSEERRKHRSLSVRPVAKIQAEENTKKIEPELIPIVKKPVKENFSEKLQKELQELTEEELQKEVMINSYKHGKAQNLQISKLKKKKGLNRLNDIFDVMSGVENKIIKNQLLSENVIMKHGFEKITTFMRKTLQEKIKEKNKEFKNVKKRPDKNNIYNKNTVYYGTEMKQNLQKILGKSKNDQSSFENEEMKKIKKLDELFNLDKKEFNVYTSYSAKDCGIRIKHGTTIRNIRNKYKDQLMKLKKNADQLIGIESEYEMLKSHNRKLSRFLYQKLSKFLKVSSKSVNELLNDYHNFKNKND